MNANAEKWVDALNSGDWAQASMRLHWRVIEGIIEDRFCCLGVACKLYQDEVGDLQTRQNGSEIKYDGMSGALPAKVREWLGLRTPTGIIPGDDPTSLTGYNDSGMSFKEIADIIEGEPKGLFNDGA